MNYDYRKHPWHSSITKTSVDNLVKDILKYRIIDNAWKQFAFKEIEYRYRLGLSDQHQDTETNLLIIKNEFPECFL